MIQSFRNTQSEAFFVTGDCPPQWSAIKSVLLRKLDILNAASVLADLKIPPGNRLEKLLGSRKGQWSIRVNDQWRICFRWHPSGPCDVEVVDYH